VDRREFVTGVVLGLFAAPLAAEAEQAAKIARIGYLAGSLARGALTCQRPSVKDCVTSATSRAETS
jgi:hypothetical protein